MVWQFCSWSYFLTVAAVTAAYCATGWLGLRLAIPPGFATTVWPPSGISLVALLLFGYRVWPGIWLGSFLVNLIISCDQSSIGALVRSLAIAALIAVGSTLQALIAAYLIQRFIGTSLVFDQTNRVFRFVVIEALSNLVAATWGVTSLCLAGIVPWIGYGDSWRTWWLGDLIGAYTVAPLLLTWARSTKSIDQSGRPLELVLSMLVIALATLFIFDGPFALASSSYPLVFLIMPLLFLIAVRCGPRGTTLAICLISSLAIRATIFGHGPFVRTNTNESLLLLQSFIGIVSMTGLALAASIVERDLVQTKLLVSQAQYQDLYENAPDMYCSVESKTAIISNCNNTLVRALGLTKTEIIDKPIFEIYHPDCLTAAKQAFESFVQTGDVHNAELQLKCIDGSPLDVVLNVSSVRDEQGNILYSRSCWTDISNLKRSERQLQQLNDELEQRVSNRTVQLQQASNELKQLADRLALSNQELQQFNYIVAHDLQEPLRTIANFANLLESTTLGKLDQEESEFVSIILDANKRMQRFITDLLAYSRIDRFTPQLTLVDSTQIVSDALINLHVAIKESKGCVTVDKLPEVIGNQVQLTQLFQNLIGNSLKYRGSSLPLIQISCKKRDNNSDWLFIVQDNSIGFDMQFAQKIFEPFQRLHTWSKYQGTGIGLAICKKIVEQHGGEIWAQSRPNQAEGATLFFTIPSNEGESR